VKKRGINLPDIARKARKVRKRGINPPDIARKARKVKKRGINPPISLRRWCGAPEREALACNHYK